MRRVNVYFLILKSYNNNLNDVLNILSFLRNFDKDIILDLSQLIKIYIFALYIIKDIF